MSIFSVNTMEGSKTLAVDEHFIQIEIGIGREVGILKMMKEIKS